jgi:predicted nucleic acid-binding protein
MIGPIRQEILSGISNPNQFIKLCEILRSFEDLPLTSSDYERAAEMFSLCRKKGVQGSHVDFIICAAAEKHHLSIFTLDHDFQHFAKHIPISLFVNGSFKN